ncbi:hypothetical protein ACTMU2_33215 [Cupriavidus basilensis]
MLMMPRQELTHKLPPAAPVTVPAVASWADGAEGAMNLFKSVRPNIVQSIRAFRVPDLPPRRRPTLVSISCTRIARIARARRRSWKRSPPRSRSPSISARTSTRWPTA